MEGRKLSNEELFEAAMLRAKAEDKANEEFEAKKLLKSNAATNGVVKATEQLNSLPAR